MTLLIAIGNRMQTGKDTFSYYLRTALSEKYGVVSSPVSFADPLKSAMASVFGLPDGMLRGDGAARDAVVPEWVQNIIDPRWREGAAGPMTCRQAMQIWGCQMRDHYPGMWVEAAMARSRTSGFDLVVMADMRFQDEFDAVKEAGGYTIQMSRGVPNPHAHFSEATLDNADYDLRIQNDLTLRELRHTANMVADWVVTDGLLPGKIPIEVSL